MFIWYYCGMKATIDRGGRVVIPKPLRDKAGLEAGTEVDIRFTEGIVEIIPSPAGGGIVPEDGLWVWEPSPGTPPVAPGEIRRAIEEIREERQNRIIRGMQGFDEGRD